MRLSGQQRKLNASLLKEKSNDTILINYKYTGGWTTSYLTTSARVSLHRPLLL